MGLPDSDRPVDITDPVDVAHLAFGHEDGVLIGSLAEFESYVDSTADGAITADVYISDLNLEGGGGFRYRIEYLGDAPHPPAPEPPSGV